MLALLLTFAVGNVAPTEVCPHPLPIERIVSDGKRVYTFVKRTPVYRDTRAWDVAKEREVWRNEVNVFEVVAGTVGKESLWITGKTGPSTKGISMKDGKSSIGVGSPAINERATSIAAMPDDRWVWVGVGFGLVRLTPDDVQAFKHVKTDNGGVTALSLDGRGKRLAFGGSDGSIGFADAKNASLEKSRAEGSRSPVTALRFDSKGKLLASGSEDGSVRLWSASGKARGVLAEAGAAVQDLAFDPKGKWLAVLDDAGKLTIYDLKEEAALVELSHGSLNPKAGLAIVDKGKTIVAAGETTLLSWTVKDLGL